MLYAIFVMLHWSWEVLVLAAAAASAAAVVNLHCPWPIRQKYCCCCRFSVVDLKFGAVDMKVCFWTIYLQVTDDDATAAILLFEEAMVACYGKWQHCYL